MTFNDLRAGHYVAVVSNATWKSRNKNSHSNVNCTLGTVSRATNKLVYVGGLSYLKDTGKPTSRHVTSVISLEVEHLRLAYENRDQMREDIKKREKTIAERNARITFQLARRIIDSVDPDTSIARLETLGEAKLKELVQLLGV